MELVTKTAAISTASDYFGIIRRRSVYLLTIIPAAVLIATFFAFAIQPLYESTITILRESSVVVGKDVVESTVSHSDQQIEIVQSRVMDSDALEQLVKEYDPYPNVAGLSVAQKAQKIADNTTLEHVDPVTLKPLAESEAFSVHYDNPDPIRARKVAGRLGDLFVTYNQRSRSETARKAAVFLQRQAESISAQMRVVDQEIAKLKTAHGDALPELAVRNQASIDRYQHDLDILQQQILADQGRESGLAVQLSQMSPNLITQSGDLTDIATIRAKLAEAEQRYTPDHPEVKRLKAALQTMTSQTATRPNGIAANANNPQYLITAAQLTSVRNEISNLQAQANKARSQIDQYETLLRRTPEVETQYADILRRQKSLQTEYQEVHDKLQNALQAQTFESEEQGERFTMLRDPSHPHLPVYPNRIGLILIGLVLGCGLAAAFVVIAEMMDSNIRGTRDLPSSDGLAVLASIPFIANKQDVRRRRMRFAYFAAAYGIAIAVVGVTVVGKLHL